MKEIKKIKKPECSGGLDWPEVTWLIPVLNAMPFLPETLASIEAQDYPGRHRVLVWDNGSSDGSVDCLKEWIPSRLSGRVVTERPLPFGACLAEMVREADSEYLARLDGDDLASPDRLSKQIRWMQNHPETGALGGQVRKIDEQGNDLSTVTTHPCSFGHLLLKFTFTCPYVHPTVLLRRSEVFRSGNYRDEDSVVVDYSLWLRMMANCKLHNLPDLLGSYRINSEGITRTAERTKNSKQLGDHCLNTWGPILYGDHWPVVYSIQHTENPCTLGQVWKLVCFCAKRDDSRPVDLLRSGTFRQFNYRLVQSIGWIRYGVSRFCSLVSILLPARGPKG